MNKLALNFLGFVCVVTLVSGYNYGYPMPYGAGAYGAGAWGAGTQPGIGGGGFMNFFFMRKSIQLTLVRRKPGPRLQTLFNSTEHEIYPAHKFLNAC